MQVQDQPCFALAVSCCSAAFVLWCCLASTESVEPTRPAMGGHRYLLGRLQLWCKSKDALPCILDLCLTLRWGAAFKPVLDRFLSCRINDILKGECFEDCGPITGIDSVCDSAQSAKQCGF